MIEVRETDEQAEWFKRLRDRQARARINTRIRRLTSGNPGDVKPVGEGVSTTIPAIESIVPGTERRL